MQLHEFRKGKTEYKYIEEGEGPVILLLHGLMGELSNFTHLIEHLPSKGYKVVAPLFPVFDLPKLKTSVAGLCEFLKHFVDEKGFTQFTPLGNSLGGHVGLYFTNKYPEYIENLVLTGSSGLYENAMGVSYPKRGDKDFMRRKVEEVFYDPKMATEELIEEVFETVGSTRKAMTLVLFAKSAIRHNMGKDIEKMNVPVCLIWGKNDIVTPPEVATEFHERLPQSDLFWIDQCGHAAMMEKPQEFFDTLLPWLNEKYKKN